MARREQDNPSRRARQARARPAGHTRAENFVMILNKTFKTKHFCAGIYLNFWSFKNQLIFPLVMDNGFFGYQEDLGGCLTSFVSKYLDTCLFQFSAISK